VIGVVAALALTGCSSSGGAAASSGTGAGSGSGKKVNLAMFIVATANAHQQAAVSGAKAAAAKAGNATVHVFGANFDPKTQVNQIQDATASGQYNAFLVDAVDGTVVVPAIEKALAKGIKVACGFSICGTDQRSFSKQIPGVVAQINADYTFLGRAGANAIGKGCANINPCNAVYMDGTPTLAADVLFTKGWYDTIAKYPNVKVVAKGAGEFVSQKASQAMKDIITAHPDINAVGTVGEQMAVGIAQAIAGSSLANKKVILVGDGASREAVKGINAGTWYGSTLLRPYTEGNLGAADVIGAVRGVKPAKTLVNSALDPAIPEGYISKATVGSWKPEWSGN